MINKNPSRILNENSTFMGLTVFDFAGAGYLLIITHALLAKINLELLSFPILAGAVISLIGIRTKHRKKTIRDYFAFTLTKKINFKTGVSL